MGLFAAFNEVDDTIKILLIVVLGVQAVVIVGWMLLLGHELKEDSKVVSTTKKRD
eukprot:CAMPEP_0202445186 /NCGR_PEP_ID=MMETSP1360-20130828/4064_1 /ASSEMBLY_ACC=CAM_ASM_000848 /TAXON_ID=515479 /ORGANISM="Licmophora paradoxa, Strain CCMP2313" /LENGTH=54 /DNA_ID=CAMNT_0049061371 /DNA_START=23 /DNA_END=187 /DNA_ORIENTATION=+